MMNSLKRLVSIGLSLFFTITATPAASQTDWFSDQADIFFYPGTIGTAPRIIESTGEFVGLMETPALKLVRCSADLNCAWEAVESDLAGISSLGPVYLFEDETGIFALYEHRDSGEIRLARPEENGWNKSALDLPQPCPELLSAFYQPAGWLGLLCADEEGRFVYQWREDDAWQADDQLGLVTENDETTNQSLAILSDGRPYLAVGNEANAIRLFHPESAKGWVGETINIRATWEPRIVVNDADRLFVFAQNMTSIIKLQENGNIWQEAERGFLELGAYYPPYIFNAGLTAAGEGTCLFRWIYEYVPPRKQSSIYGYIVSDSADYNYFIWDLFTDFDYGPIYLGQFVADDNTKALVVGAAHADEPEEAVYFVSSSEFVSLGSEYNHFDRLSTAARRVDGGLTPYAIGSNQPYYHQTHTLHRKTAEGWNILDRLEFDYSFYDDPITTADDSGLYLLHDCDASLCLMRYSFDGSRHDLVIGDYDLYRGDIAAYPSGLAFVAVSYVSEPLRFWRKPSGEPIAPPIAVDEGATFASIAICPDETARILYYKNHEVILANEVEGFAKEVIDSTGIFTQHSDYAVACDSHGVVHIAYENQDGLIYGVQTGDGWSLENLGGAFKLIDMVVAQGDQIYLAYLNSSHAYVVTRPNEGWEALDLLAYWELGLWSDGEDIMICYQTYTDLHCQSSAPIVGYTGGGDDDDNNNDNDNDDDDNNDNNDNNNDNDDDNDDNNDDDDNNDNNEIDDDDVIHPDDDDDNDDNDNDASSPDDDDDDDDDERCG